MKVRAKDKWLVRTSDQQLHSLQATRAKARFNSARLRVGPVSAMTKALWTAWILGVMLILASWAELVDPVVGWGGFSLATAAAIVSFIVASSGKARPMPDESARSERLWQENERQLEVARQQQEESARQQEIARRHADMVEAQYQLSQSQLDLAQQHLERQFSLLATQEDNATRAGALLERVEKLADRLSSALDRLETPNRD